MRLRTVLVLVALVAFGPALLAVGSQEVAEAFGCQVDLNRVIPCVIGGKDYGQTFYDLGFLIWYSYLSLPVGLALLGVWAVAALVAFMVIRRRQNRPPSEPLSPGKSFLRGALIAVPFAF
jgi:TRAP-type C4-dicarboxylate transport system permease small subunit